jgi:hypothetical protein
VDAAASRRPSRYRSRPGRVALVADSLAELRGPTDGTVELPRRLVWQAPELRRFDLDDPYERGRLYEIVLREAIRLDELRAWLDGVVLRQVWSELYLPRGVRRAWEERHRELRSLDAVA